MRITLFICALFFASAAVAAPAPEKVVAVVGDQVISSLDLDARVYLVMATTGIPDTPETRARLTPQILRQLIDEKLQMQDATANGITVTDDKIQAAIAQIEKQNNQPPGSLEQLIESRGASKASFDAQLRAQVAWVELIGKKIRPRIRVSDQEVARYVARKTSDAAVEKAAGNTNVAREVKIAVIQLPVDSPKNEASVRKVAEKLAEEIHAGVSFEKVATQFSHGMGAGAAEPFWVDVAQLDPAIRTVLSTTAKGTVTAPVKTGSGYQILKLVDSKDNGTAPAKETPAPVSAAPAPREEYAFRQIIISAKPGAKSNEKALLAIAGNVAKAPGGCTDKVVASAAGTDADVKVSLLRRVSTDLPDKVRDTLSGLKVGGISQPLSAPDGVRLFMLCERVDLPPEKATPEADRPSDEAIRQKIYSEKLELEVQKYMRTLREQGFIEVRGM